MCNACMRRKIISKLLLTFSRTQWLDCAKPISNRIYYYYIFLEYFRDSSTANGFRWSFQFNLYCSIAGTRSSVCVLLTTHTLNFAPLIRGPYHQLIIRYIRYAYILVRNFPNYLCMIRWWSRSSTVRVYPIPERKNFIFRWQGPTES